MPRPAAITPNSRLSTTLPPDVRVRLELFLHSELEGRVPKGAYQAFLTARINEFFSEKPLDLAPFLGSMPGELVVRGSVGTIAALQQLLTKGPRREQTLAGLRPSTQSLGGEEVPAFGGGLAEGS